MSRALALLLTGLTLAGAAGAQTVSFNGSLGRKAALLLIDGQPHTVPLGQSVGPVRLLALDEDRATIELDGRRQVLVLGATPGRVGDVQTPPPGRQIVLASGPGGHFIASGSINGQATQFLVDTGATNIALAQAEAERLGLKFRAGRRVMTQTANGTVPAHLMQLDVVRIGDVTVRNVDAIVVPGQMSHVLLGNSFLARFQMRRENDLMTLELRY
jgi:aspartyl protease family protein